MANLWDNLSDEEKKAVAMAGLQGQQKSPENLNRMMSHLAQNPDMVTRLAKEAGLEEGTDSDQRLEDTDPDAEMTPEEEASDIERNVNESLSDENNIQETGEVSAQGDIPAPEPGETLDQYMQRLMMLQRSTKGGTQGASYE